MQSSSSTWRSLLVLFSTLVILLGSLQPHATSRAMAASRLHSVPQQTGPTDPSTNPHQLSKQTRTEVPSLRTRTSRTYALSNGEYQAELFPGPVNYQDSNGTWRAIDNTLAGDSAGFVNRANAYRVHFPHNLGQAPIRVETADGWVEFRPQGVNAEGAVSGDTATFATSGVAWHYTAGNRGVKEAITLAGPSSPQSFTYALHTGPGLTAQQDGSGGIAIINASGTTAATFDAPYMYDSSGSPNGVSHALTLTLGQSASGQTMTLSADAHWLADPARRYPVTIDPSLTLGIQGMQGGQDCKLVGGSYASTNFCRQQNLTVGYDGTTANRALVEMNPSFLVSNGYIPATATVQSARLGLYLYGSSNGTATTVSAYALSRSWTQGATWNTYDGTNAWSTAGGQFSSQPTATTTVTPTAGWVYWYPSAQMVQGWMDGSGPNNGLILKEPTETTANLLQFYSDEYATSSYWPSLQITYSFMAGEQSHYTSVDQGIHDGLGVSVNVASGNLLAKATDFAMPGIGMDVGVDRVYNSLTSSVCVYDLGYGWHTGDGETWLDIYPDGSLTFQGPSGEEVPFVRNSNGSFTSPPGIDADLVQNGDGSYTLTDHRSWSKLNFTSGGLLASTVDRVGNRLSYSYNSFPTLAAITDTQGRTTTVTTNAPGQLITQVKDPAGRTYSYGYDANGNMTSTTDAAGKVTQYVYDGTHLLTQVTTPNGLVTKIAYDGSRRATSITNVTDTSSGTGPTTTYASDSRGRATAVTEPDNTVSHTSWTADNHVASETSPKNETTTYTYDTGNNLTQMQMPGGQSMSWGYSTPNTVTGSQYLPSSATDEEGRTTNYGYTAQGLLNSSTDALNHGSSAAYNSNGTLQSATDENGHTTGYQYVSSGTNVGMPSGITYPSGLGPVSFTYDAANQPATGTDGRGQRTTYSFDALGRTTGMGYTNTDGSNGGSQGYAYDTDGQLLSMAETSGGVTKTTGYTYNLLGQLTQKTLPNGATVSYTYDGEGNLLSKTDGGGTTTYTYTANDEPATVKDPSGATTTLTYDPNGHETTVAYPNGVTQNMSYDSGGQLTRIWAVNSGGTTLSSYSYTYTNPSSNRLTTTRYSMTDMNGSVTNYSYDVLNRLTQAIQKNSGGTQTASYGYGYDAVGNMTSKAINGSSTSMAYNAADQLTSAGSASYSYDPNGNQTGSSGGVSLAYNSQDQTTGMTYTGAGQAERTGNGTSSYAYDGTGMGLLSNAAGTTYFTNGPNGQLISERVPGKGTYYYLFDGLGSVVGLTDSSGNVVNRYSYDPYGNTTGVTEGVSNPFRYIGAVWDSSTGLYQMGERYYDPKVGRFTQPDPLDGQTYAYTAGNPVNYVDPSGLYEAPSCLSCGEGGGPSGGVYEIVDPVTGNIVKTGRTNNFTRRAGEYARAGDTRQYEFRRVHHTDDRAEQRGLEQHVYNRNRGARLNKIRPISRRNPNRGRYLKAARRHLHRDTHHP